MTLFPSLTRLLTGKERIDTTNEIANDKKYLNVVGERGGLVIEVKPESVGLVQPVEIKHSSKEMEPI